MLLLSLFLFFAFFLLLFWFSAASYPFEIYIWSDAWSPNLVIFHFYIFTPFRPLFFVSLYLLLLIVPARISSFYKLPLILFPFFTMSFGNFSSELFFIAFTIATIYFLYLDHIKHNLIFLKKGISGLCNWRIAIPMWREY